MKAHIVLPCSVNQTQVTIPITIPDRYAKALLRESMRSQDTDESAEDSKPVSGKASSSMVTVRIARTLISRYDSIKNTVSYHSLPSNRIKIEKFQGKEQYIFADLGEIGKVGIIWDMKSELAARMIKEKTLYVAKEETGAVLITATKEHLITSSILDRFLLDKETTAVTLIIPADVVDSWPDGSLNNMLAEYEQTVKRLREAAREKFIDLLLDESYALTVSGHNAIRGINRSLRDHWENFKIMLEDPSGGIITLRITSPDPDNFEEVGVEGNTGTMFEISGVISDADDSETSGTYLFAFSKK